MSKDHECNESATEIVAIKVTAQILRAEPIRFAFFNWDVKFPCKVIDSKKGRNTMKYRSNTPCIVRNCPIVPIKVNAVNMVMSGLTLRKFLKTIGADKDPKIIAITMRASQRYSGNSGAVGGSASA
jgi:hypothetical protein